MSGLPCAKVIIDNGNRLMAALQCMNASIVLNANEIQPTIEMETEFVRLAESLAQYAAKIERYVGVGTTTTTRSARRTNKEEDRVRLALDAVAPINPTEPTDD